MRRTNLLPEDGQYARRASAKLETYGVPASRWAAQIRLLLVLLMTVACLTPRTYMAAQTPSAADDALSSLPTKDGKISDPSILREGSIDTLDNTPRKLNEKQMKLLQSRFEKTKNDAAEMASLAKQLREKLSLPDADALSPEVASLAEKIEKLAKKIRGENSGY